MPFFDIFASPRWSPVRMRTKVVSFFIFFKSFQTKNKIKALRPKMAKIASMGSCRVIPAWLSDSKSPCHNITLPWLCMVIPGNLPNRHAMAPPVCNWSPTGTNPADRRTHTPAAPVVTVVSRSSRQSAHACGYFRDEQFAYYDSFHRLLHPGTLPHHFLTIIGFFLWTSLCLGKYQTLHLPATTVDKYIAPRWSPSQGLADIAPFFPLIKLIG